MSGSPEEEKAGGGAGRGIEDLLPWHAAGTLGLADARRVEAALADDPELARRLDLAREELAATLEVNEALGVPSARAMDALFARIDAEPARRPSLGLAARLAGFLASLSPRTLAFAASAAALVIAIQAGVIGSAALTRKPAAVYQTASTPSAPAEAGAFLLIRFAPGASLADVTAFLEAHDATIAGGPVAGGFYRVRVAAQALPKAKLATLSDQLGHDKVVDFISPTE